MVDAGAILDSGTEPSDAAGSPGRGRVTKAWQLMKIREMIKLLESEGWYQVAQKGSHRQFKHDTKPGRVTVAGKPNDDLAPGTENSILRQAGLKD